MGSADDTSAVSVSECSQDYIEIIGGTSAAIAAAGIVSDHNMWCGRNFATLTAETGAITTAAGTSVCTASAPFRIRVNFDEDEYRTNKDPTIVDTDSTDGEFLIRLVVLLDSLFATQRSNANQPNYNTILALPTQMKDIPVKKKSVKIVLRIETLNELVHLIT